jgi:hypothetical protein
MTLAVPRTFVLLGAILAVTACGITLSPSTSPQASGNNEPASQPAEVPAVVCVPAPMPFKSTGFDLTGAWAGDDGGIYYLRQIGSVVWWNGMAGRDRSPFDLGRDWNNVARGVIDGLQIDVETSDVPRGGADFKSTLVLNIQDDGAGNMEIVKTREVKGGFGNSIWTPCRPVEQQLAYYLATYGGTVREYVDILALDACDKLAEVKNSVTSTMNTQEAGSPEFRASLGYSNVISDRELELNC